MKGKKLFYFGYTIKISILFVFIYMICASSYKIETYSTNENVNKWSAIEFLLNKLKINFTRFETAIEIFCHNVYKIILL